MIVLDCIECGRNGEEKGRKGGRGEGKERAYFGLDDGWAYVCVAWMVVKARGRECCGKDEGSSKGDVCFSGVVVVDVDDGVEERLDDVGVPLGPLESSVLSPFQRRNDLTHLSKRATSANSQLPTTELIFND